MENQYHFCNPFPTYESLVPKGYLAYSKTNFTHSIGRRPKILLVILLGVIISFQVTAVPCWSTEKTPKEVVFSLETEGTALKDVFHRIRKMTGFEVQICEELENVPITVRLNNVPFEEGLKRILKYAGVNTYALVENSKEKVYQVYVFGWMKGINRAARAKGRGKEVGRNIVHGKSLTLKELEAMNRRSVDANPGSVILIPPSEANPNGIRLGEIEAMNRRPADADPGSVILIPPSEANPNGITLGAVEAMNRRPADADPGSVILIPPSGENPRGITLGELEQINARPVDSVPSVVLLIPPSDANLRGVTLGELEAMNTSKVHFDPGTVNVLP
jgi:hypothetical protein